MKKIPYAKLIRLARSAQKRAYAPYSKYKVGAAVLSSSGKIFTGCNVENASYGLTQCAERGAIEKAVSEGSRDLLAIAIVAPGGPASPCGACRQVISEFGKDMEVVLSAGKNKMVVEKISELLPGAFGARFLK